MMLDGSVSHEPLLTVEGLSAWYDGTARFAGPVLSDLSLSLSHGETVKLSSFGTFAVRQKSQRMGRNPKTGDEVPIAPRRVLVFRPSHVLKAVINGQTPVFEAEE